MLHRHLKRQYCLRGGGTGRVVEFRGIPVEAPPLGTKDPEPTLRAGCQVLADLRLTYWLSAGTLLGLYRDRRFIPHDNDLDVGVRLDYAAKRDNARLSDGVCGAMSAIGWDLVRSVHDDRQPMQLAFLSTDGVLFDVFFYYQGVVDDNLVNFNDIGVLTKSAHFFETVSLHRFYLGDYPTPPPIEGYLRMLYGDSWRIPKTQKDPWQNEVCHLRDALPGRRLRLSVLGLADWCYLVARRALGRTKGFVVEQLRSGGSG